MKIAFLSTLCSHTWGGSETLWSETAIALIQRGYGVAAFIDPICEEHPKIQQIKKIGGQIHTRRTNKATPLKDRLLQKISTQPNQSKLEGFLEANKPDLVCISDGLTFERPHWHSTLHARGIPVVNLAQSNAEALWPSDSQAEKLRILSRKALKMCFVSKANLNLFEHQIASRLTNACVVRNPFKTNYSKTYDWPQQESPIVLSFLARLEPYPKGHDLLLQLLADQKWRDRALQVNCYGSGYCANGIKHLISMHNLNETVFLKGQVNDAEQIWSQCHGLILPSRLEGLPLSIVEAMFAGRPIITTDVAGNAELLEDNVTGFIARAATVDALDEALERAWKRRLEWKMIGQAAAESARQQLPSDPAAVFADNLVQWYNDSKAQS